jgi:tetratricopeptide (TPR) repeat protein
VEKRDIPLAVFRVLNCAPAGGTVDRNDEVRRAIRQRDIGSIVALIFEPATFQVRPGFSTETELWDFKQGCPRPGKQKEDEIGWSNLAVDILAFHNLHGGLIVLGVGDRDLRLCPIKHRLDSKIFNDQMRKFFSDRIWVEFYRIFIQADQSYVGVAVVPPRGPSLERFQADAPVETGPRFRRGESAIREGDSSRILKKDAADAVARQISVPLINQTYIVNEPYFRILAPEYAQFVERPGPCKDIEAAMNDPRSAVAALVGIGGTGKTALATWATLRAYDRKDYEFIASITAKDRELTSAGIRALEPGLTSFEALLDTVLDVLGFPDLKSQALVKKEAEVRGLLGNSTGLLLVDNLETVDDARIIQFLDSLPIGVRALTTSRRSSVRVSVHPVPLGALTEKEVIAFIGSLASSPGLGYARDLTTSECIRIGGACDGLPLAIRWTLVRSESASEALATAEAITATSRKGEELLEFCFRRVFDAMSGSEQEVLEVLSLFQRPLPSEAIVVGSGAPAQKVGDAVDDLFADSIIKRLFDPDRNDYCYTLFPVTRAFVTAHMNRQHGLADKMRSRMADWFEARDVEDPAERLVVREVRQGKGGSETALIDLGRAAERRGDVGSAEAMYQQALQRNPASWKAARVAAEFYRHKMNDTTQALRLYEKAAGNAPRRGPDRALIFREWGMLLRDCGDPEATDKAIGNFEIALQETPNDVLATHALAHMLSRKGKSIRVIELLEPLAKHGNTLTREKTMPILLEAYEQAGELLKAAQLKAQMQDGLQRTSTGR